MKNSYRTILEMNHKAAKRFLLKPESYCNFSMPFYFDFESMLTEVDQHLKRTNLAGLTKCKPSAHEDVNHVILHNKDGKYAWRPFQLIHPALYVSLVQTLTTKDNWHAINKRFREFSSSDKIKCLSIPVESCTQYKDIGQQILVWWDSVEQQSIELALEYEYFFQTDIVDCYGSLYTHSIPWALHTREIAKQQRTDNNLIGNRIDKALREMAQGQTNGIPQGSVAMDFIAEMVLGYADSEISEKLDADTDYKILRFRDDYRIFVNNPNDGEEILRAITETMIDLGMKLNPSKTMMSNQTVRQSIKLDKLSWMAKKQSHKNLQKHLLLIHSHAIEFPNSGSLVPALLKFQRKIEKMTPKQFINVNLMPIISIVIDIASNSPRVYPEVTAILSQLLGQLNDDEKKREVIWKILTRFSRILNTNHLEIWLQRIYLVLRHEPQFNEPLCKLVAGEDVDIWNSDWITCNELRNLVKSERIIDRNKIDQMPPEISIDEIELFHHVY